MGQKAWNFLQRWGLATACVVAPLILGVYGNHFLTTWLTDGSKLCAVTRQLSFRLLDEATPSPLKLSPEQQKRCDQLVVAHNSTVAAASPTSVTRPAGAAAASTSGTSVAPAASAEKLPPQLVLVANHIAGRLNVTYGYAFLALVSVLAFLFGSVVVIRYSNVVVWLAVTAVFFFITRKIGYADIQGEDMRAIVADNILARADADALLQFMPAKANLQSLIWVGLNVGYLSVGLILASLFCASIRWADQSSLEGLKERRWIIRVGLVLGSAILVVVVLSSRAVFDWPLSLLEAADRKALAPAADALVRKWGAIGSISLLGAFIPAVTAWYLDRDAYRNAPQPKKKAVKKMPDEGELEIAPMSTVTSILAILAPIIASPIFDALKSLVATVQK